MLRLSDFIRYTTEGSREAYENPCVSRRSTLMKLAYLEAIENKGKYFYNMLDVLWAILEETQWCIPAHNNYSHSQDIIPHEGDSALDIFTSNTACDLSSVYRIFQEKLDAVSPELGERIRRKIKKEMFDNLLENDYRWMGYGRIPNNWNPWIISNTVKCVVNLGVYDAYTYRVLARCAQVISMYWDQFPLDGGCDEGAEYWAMGCGSMIEYAYVMYCLTNGALDILSEEKLLRMTDFPFEAYVSPRHLLGFSDLTINAAPEWGLLSHLAKYTGNRRLMTLAKKGLQSRLDSDGDIFEINSRASRERMLMKGEGLPMVTAFGRDESFSLGHAYPSIGLFLARERQEEPFGLLLAVKANHNGESHNHLDTGSYIVYKDQVPFLVDAGARTYDAMTFSPRRYTLWHTRSEYHNLPIIGGAQQEAGAQFRAEDVVFGGSSVHFSLKEAYDCDFLYAYDRSFTLNRENSRILLQEHLELDQERNVTFVFMTPARVIAIDRGIALTHEGREMIISYDKDLTLETDIIDDTDARFRSTWADGLTRIRLTGKVHKGTVTFVIT